MVYALVPDAASERESGFLSQKIHFNDGHVFGGIERADRILVVSAQARASSHRTTAANFTSFLIVKKFKKKMIIIIDALKCKNLIIIKN